MKQRYSKKVILPILVILLAYPPPKSYGQCTCADGLPATAIQQSVTIAPTTANTLIFTFQQFDPSIGTLSCVRVRDTISGVTTTSATNTGPTATDFLFQLTLNNKITGPGITISQLFNRTYGYNTLGPFGSSAPPDNITYGPDAIFTNAPGTGSTGGNAGYLGLGTVDLTYKINGGMIALDGGLNYNSSIVTTIGGTIALTYYWCPATILANSITGFSAVKSGNTVGLHWTGENEQNTEGYTIEYSKDGEHFSSAGKQLAIIGESGSTAYEFTYNIATTDGTRLFFRIKKTNTSGLSAYSQVRVINLGNANALSNFQIYPNPSSKHINLEWSSAVSGNVNIIVVNSTGQQFYNKTTQLHGGNQVQFDLPAAASPGIYYMLVTDLSSNNQQMSKLFVH
jgi:hypothetical protein